MSITFNGVAFKSPSIMSQKPELAKVSNVRSFNNVMITRVFSYTAKKEYELQWNFLTAAEVDLLESYALAGQIPVASTITNHTWSLTLAVVTITSNIDHTYSGIRKDVKILVSEA